MLRLAFTLLLLGCVIAQSAQTPARSPGPAATVATSPPATPSPTPSATPTGEALIDSMGSADLQQAIQLLKSNFINPDALNETELNRALLSGVLARLGRGAMILPERTDLDGNTPFFGEVLDGHIGYLRLGALNPANLQALDAQMQTFTAKKVDAVVIDLRASPATNDFAVAAEFAKRFVTKGKPLFSL